MTAVVGMPTTPEIDDPYAGKVNLKWVGQIVDADGEIYVDDPFVPEIFGRMLVDTYWELDANIEDWWDLFVRGDHHPSPPSDDGGESDWGYIGTARFLIIFKRGDERWHMAKVAWSDDPAAAVYD